LFFLITLTNAVLAQGWKGLSLVMKHKCN
jgi:hypothetical protein